MQSLIFYVFHQITYDNNKTTNTLSPPKQHRMPDQPPTQLELFNWKRQLIKQSAPFFNGLTDEMKETLRVYKYNGYLAINKFLSSENKKYKSFGEFVLDKDDWIMAKQNYDEFQKFASKINKKTTLGQLSELIQRFHYDSYNDVITNLDKCFKQKVPKLKNPQPDKKTVLYRGTYLPGKMVNSQAGKIITFGEYLSTTLNPKVAFNFTDPGDILPDGTQPVLLIIRGYDNTIYMPRLASGCNT